jgi:hypothetical protein
LQSIGVDDIGGTQYGHEGVPTVRAFAVDLSWKVNGFPSNLLSCRT